MGQFNFFEIEKQSENRMATVYLNGPDARNSMVWDFWKELPELVDYLEQDESIKCVVIASKKKSFSVGLELNEFGEKFGDIIQGATADKRMQFLKLIQDMQSGFIRMMNSPIVFLGAVHRHCIGGALDLICACDIRLAAKDASVSLRETKVAIVADMCSLNRLPGIIGQGNTRLMAFTGADYDAQKCKEMGLFSEIYEGQEELHKQAQSMANEIAANPGIVLKGVKEQLNYMADHTPEEGLKYVAVWNAAFLDSEDFRELQAAFKERRRPVYRS
ncbi:MAG TPA: enoyl-CoA hydratase [Leptospiraceae bacterium]|nr:enoyl-CoA hydratase [Spirochaetaceae bacterium]HBS05799.1 enoyl-CoA hydratase [Leptospiraceae bacterium]|tara:strand:- start:130868 stop:131689 length:822 start_codon:yes stop_codon:yes gene_type:complete